MATATSGSSRRSSTRKRAGSSSSRRRSRTARAASPAGTAGSPAGTAIALLLSLPGVDEGPCYGTPGYRVRGKLLARLREDGETLVVKCGEEAVEMWLQADPKTFFLTDHYVGYGAVLVRLSTADPAMLRDVVVESWRGLAPKRLVADYDRRAGE